MQRTKRGRQAWFGFDLDGTLAVHEEGASIDHVGAPIPAMIEQLKQHVEDGYDVRIVTARVCRTQSNDDRDYQLGIIQEWCQKHLGFVPDVTNEKDFAMVALYDDRAHHVVRNEGVVVGLEAAEEIDQIYNHLLYLVPQAHDEDGAEMTALKKIDVLQDHIDGLKSELDDEKLRRCEILNADHLHGVEGDDTASFDSSVRDDAWLSDSPVRLALTQQSSDGHAARREIFYTPREARCVAAQLLRAADEAEKAIEEFKTTERT